MVNSFDPDSILEMKFSKKMITRKIAGYSPFDVGEIITLDTKKIKGKFQIVSKDYHSEPQPHTILSLREVVRK